MHDLALSALVGNKVKTLSADGCHNRTEPLLGGNGPFRCLVGLRLGLNFLMTDSICHSSLPCTVLEKVTLTTIQFRFYPRTKVDLMFQCVYISTPLKSCPYKSSATCAWSMVSRWENRLNIYANNKGADQPARPRRLISAFVVRYSSFFFDKEASHRMIPVI